MLERPIILVDMDDTAVDTRGYWQRRIKDKYNVDPVETDEYDIRHHFPQLLGSEVMSVMMEPDFFENLEPKPGMIETIELWLESGYDVRFVSVVWPENKHGHASKMSWVLKHLPQMRDRVCLFSSHDKTLMYGSIIIDDHPSHICDARWAYPIVFDQPWNRHLTERRRAQDWDQVFHIVKRHLGERGLNGKPTQ